MRRPRRSGRRGSGDEARETMATESTIGAEHPMQSVNDLNRVASFAAIRQITWSRPFGTESQLGKV